MPKPEKVERVAELKRRIEGSDALLLTEYRGLTVSEITELRRSLAEGGASFAVVKNTLMRRAASDAGMAELEDLLSGPSAITFVEGDPIAAAKSVVKATKQFPALVLKGAFMDGKLLSADQAKALADLESREVMLSKIAGLLKGEMSRAAAMFQAGQSKFLSLLGAYKDKVPGDPAASQAAGPVEAEAVEPAEAEAAQPEVAEPTEHDETTEEPETPEATQAEVDTPEAAADAADDPPEAEASDEEAKE
ncbi:MAG: 50S ribosomal protein L10 [Actinomycetota bacterium]